MGGGIGFVQVPDAVVSRERQLAWHRGRFAHVRRGRRRRREGLVKIGGGGERGRGRAGDGLERGRRRVHLGQVLEVFGVRFAVESAQYFAYLIRIRRGWIRRRGRVVVVGRVCLQTRARIAREHFKVRRRR